MWAFCDASNLPRIRVPAGVKAIYRSAEFDVWCSEADASPWLVYGLHVVGPGAETFAECMIGSARPFFMFGVAGYGMNSYGLGILSAGRHYSVAIQSAWGSVYRSAMDGPRGALMVSAWNQAITELDACDADSGPLIVSSHFRRVQLYCLPLFDPNDDLGHVPLAVRDDSEASLGGAGIGPWWAEVPLDDVIESRVGGGAGPFEDATPETILGDLLRVLARKSRS
jgi:hypothetical protein